MVCITTDADKDGQHILMLRINFIARRYPSMIEEGMIAYLETPYARALKGKGKSEKCLAVFQDQTQMLDWLEKNKEWFVPGKGGHRVNYYKGLASSRNHDIISDIDNAPVIIVLYDKRAEQSLDIAFIQKNADKRKEWISKWRESTGIRSVEMKPIQDMDHHFTRKITSLCNHNLVEYSLETYIRAIPREDDGLKESQRKALVTALVKWSFGCGRSGPMKTSRISSFAAEETSYHYNEDCLTGTFTRMAQEFTGSNNMCYFTPEAQLGSRHQGGADAGEARYTAIDIAPWIKHVYKKEFLDVIKRVISEGREVEPEWLPSILPMHVINGFRGIATAYSTFGPNHNPYDCIRWLKQRCSGLKDPEPLTPWYNFFTGEIEITKPKERKRRSSETDEEEERKGRGRKKGDEQKEEPRKKGTKKGAKKRKGSEEEEEKKGSDEEESDSEKESDDESEEPEEPVDLDDGEETAYKEKLRRKAAKSRHGARMRTYGVFTQKGTTVRITDLPIGKWTYNYRKMLEKMRDDDEIADMEDNSKVETVDMTIKGYKGEATYKKLGLVRSEGLSNMVLIDGRGYPTRYKDTQEVLQIYYKSMIRMFKDLKALKLKNLLDAIHDVDQRLLFIISHNNGSLIIEEREDDDVYAQMDELGIDHKYYDLIKAREFGKRKIAELRKQRKALLAEYAEVEAQSPQQMWLAHLDILDEKLGNLKLCLKLDSSGKKIKIQKKPTKKKPAKPVKAIKIKIS